MSNILFLCSGNYYRSRYAEFLFNDLAKKAGIPWRAFSRGLAVDQPNNNIGRISSQTVAKLAEQGIIVPDDTPFPTQVSVDDLADAQLIVAVKESEHRPMMQQRYAEWEDDVEFWTIHDLDVETAAEALPKLHQTVTHLVEDLANVIAA